ncbi:hypothetical protein [Clostridium estertheticum]|uniref:hypothetical protein n=1 Tax=Clostridium estertheticum TaxID=238834 RepID=UPI001C7CE9F1|nr:hypothetical protein [Clostridium estertheticum]MBX4271971.1 hypothetical protein [Clostridium estertheticum]WLC80760.1 hypothetical protein KTC98_05610 [Clostridium estertheticum]
MEEIKFNWYTVITESDSLTQGDILINFPIIKTKNYPGLLEIDNDEEFEADLDIEYEDLIILTQPCDLEQAKPSLKNVILCRIHDVDESGLGKSKLCEIVKGSAPQYYMLNEYSEFNYENKDFKLDGFNFHIANFNEIESVPVEALKKYAQKISKRLRLLPPYREHLSQAFAKYFMRIGLPSDIDRTCFNKYTK